MPANVKTLASICAWAQAHFPEAFAKLDGFQKIDEAEWVSSTGQTAGGGGVLRKQASWATSIRVGRIQNTATKSVYAWVDTHGDVRLGHFSVTGYVVHNDAADPPVSFDRPYCWVKPAADEIGVARFETLVRYYLWIKYRRGTGVRTDMGVFMRYFPGACQDVAEGVTRQEQSEESQECINSSAGPSFQPVPTALGASTTPQTNAPEQKVELVRPTVTQNIPVPTLDQAFTIFKDTLFAQATAAQAVSTREKSELTTRVQGLEQELLDAAVKREKLKMDLVAAREEAEKWKTQYEVLMKDMRDTIEQRF